MRVKTVRFLVFSLMLVGLCACDYMELQNPQGGRPGGGGRPDDLNAQCTPLDETPSGNGIPEEAITYETVKAQVFDARCVSCHSSGRPSGGVNLSTFATAKARASQIQFAVERGIMPPGSATLTADEKSMISAWVAQGALEARDLATTTCSPSDNTGGAGGGGAGGDGGGGAVPPVVATTLTQVPPDADINYALISRHILQPNCMGCHSDAGNNRGGVNLETYFNVRKEIEDGLKEIQRGRMPPRPRPALSGVEVETLRRWVRLGKPR